VASGILDCVEISPEKEPVATVIWLHGLGADGHDFEPIVPELNLEGVLPVRYVFPHAPVRPVTINGGMAMRAWFDIIDMHEISLDDFLDSVDQLLALIRKEIVSGMPPERILLAGFSQGGAVALHTGLGYDRRLAGILGLSTHLPSMRLLEKERHGANQETPIMMAHGEMDPMIPMARAVATRQWLTRLGYAVRWRHYPMMHGVCTEEIRDVRAWLMEVLDA
jgi:phospholipase/carboxylesterase